MITSPLVGQILQDHTKFRTKDLTSSCMQDIKQDHKRFREVLLLLLIIIIVFLIKITEVVQNGDEIKRGRKS